MRNFTILHISDLHLSGDSDSSVDVLFAGVKHALGNGKTPRVLVLSGDLVDNPSDKALASAKKFVEQFSSLVDHVLVIPGNHDVKRFMGSFSRTHAFNETFETGQHLLLREIGLHLMPVDSTSAELARGAVNQGEYDKLVMQYYEAEATSTNLLPEERDGLLRVVAVHHHPLPLAAGEGQKILGLVTDEGLMYLESPARFLDACLQAKVSLILHGHRHVEGVARYSIQSDNYETSNAYLGTEYDKSWDTVYVLSAPSGTGRDCDAGFNVIEFTISSEGAFADVARYRRPGNRGAFTLVDAKRPNGKLRLVFSNQLIRDIAIDVEAALSNLPTSNVPEQQLLPIASQLFRRRAFMLMSERHWGQLFYATMKTRLVWQAHVQIRLRKQRTFQGQCVLEDLLALEDFTADTVLKLARHEPDDLRAKYIHNKQLFLDHLPAEYNSQPHTVEEERGRLLEHLRQDLEKCGVSTIGFGTSTWGDSSE